MKSEQKWIASNKTPFPAHDQLLLAVNGNDCRQKAVICFYLFYSSRLKDETNTKSLLVFFLEFSSFIFKRNLTI